MHTASEQVRAFDPSDTRYQSVQATFTVTTADDAGAGSLRDAIEQANASAGLDAIAFNIAGGGSYQEIFLQTELPVVTEAVAIDGGTQGCDTSAGLCVRLDGQAVPDAVDGGGQAGLTLRGGGSTVRGFVFTRFFLGDPDIALGIESSDNTVAGCYFGTDRTGMVTDPDGTPGSGDELGNGFGIALDARPRQGNATPVVNNVIGGETAADRNVVSGSTFSGILVSEVDATENRVVGNYVGTNADGSAAFPNGQAGILLIDSRQNVIENNLTSGNIRYGIAIQDGADGNIIRGNQMGTDATGTMAVPNGTLAGLAAFRGNGIVFFKATNNIVEDNLISGNLFAGVFIGAGFPDAEAASNVVRRNRIGTDVTGELPLPNGVPGIADVGFGVVLGSSEPTSLVRGNVIGGDSIDDANVIAYNTTGGIGAQGFVVGNVINHNLIGVTWGEQPAPNGQVGILFRNGPSGNRIGSTAPDFEDDVIGNAIGFQSLAVAIGGFSTGNEVAFNTIAGPVAPYLPIDLGADGSPTANDDGDADEGPNRLQNTPTILNAQIDGDQVTVRYRVDTAPENAAYPLTVRFYGRAVADGLLGYIPLGNATYTEPGEATATFENVLNMPPVIVATATDADGNTSEMSLTGVAVASDGAPEAGHLGVRVGPNPTAGAVQFAVELAAPAEVSIAIFDALGRTVATASGGTLGAGAHAIPVELALPAGVYLWRLRAGDGVKTGQVTVVR